MTDCGGAKDRVLQRLESDLSSADMQWSLFMSALESYRHDSILRPFPSAYVEDDGSKNVQRLVSVNSRKPVYMFFIRSHNVLPATMYTVVRILPSIKQILREAH